MADFIKGETMILFIWDGTAYRPVACLTSNSISSAREVIETQTKCAPGQVVKSAGSFSYSIALEGNYIDTTSTGGDTDKASHDYLLGLQMTGDNITWRMSTGLADQAYYYGTAAITELEADFPAGNEFATFSGTLDGSGTILLTDPEATT